MGIEVKLHPVGGEIDIFENGRYYVAEPHPKLKSNIKHHTLINIMKESYNLLNSWFTFTYDLKENGNKISSVQYGWLSDKFIIEKRNTEIYARATNKFNYNNKEYRIKINPISSKFTINRENNVVGRGIAGTRKIGFEHYDEELGDIAKELMVGYGLKTYLSWLLILSCIL